MRFLDRFRHAQGGAIPGGVRDDSVPVLLTPGGLWADPWDSCLDVDPFTGQPDHQHGDACEGNCT